jgi:small conductance mechanosensitive channel
VAAAQGYNDILGDLSKQINIASFNAILGIIGELNLAAIAVRLLALVLTILVTYAIAKIADNMLQKQLPRFMDRVESGVTGKADDAADRTLNVLIRRLATASIYILGAILIVLQVPQLQKLATAVLAGAGIAGLAIGLAAKDPLANIASGISLAVFQPFRVGDYIDFKGDYGRIEDLTLRHVIIRTWDNKRIIVPNSLLSTEPIINWSIKEPEVYWTINFKIAYASDIDDARRIIEEEAENHPMVLKDREIAVLLDDPDDGSAQKLKLFINVPGRDIAYGVGCDIREAVEKRFELEGIRKLDSD